MKRLGGPELRLPDMGALRDRLSGLRGGSPGGGKAAELAGRVKAPPFLVDLYWDLRDRHLLPLVALAAIACVAAPILLGSSSKSEAPAPTPGTTAGPPSEAVEGGGRSLALAEAEPGLREPSKRLRGRSAQDPFKPHLPAKASGGSGAGGQGAAVPPGGGESGATIATTTTPAPAEAAAGGGSGSSPGSGAVGGSGGSSPGGGPGGSETGPAERPPAHNPPSGPGGGGGNGAGGGQGGNPGGGEGGSGSGKGGSGSGGSGKIQLFSFAIDVKITKTTTEANGAKSKPRAIEKERVLPPSPLPYKKRQVVTYLGISPTTRKPLFLVSEAVGAVFGEAKCVAGEGRCQLVELEKGFPVTFVYGENDVRYKIQVLKIEPVAVGHS